MLFAALRFYRDGNLADKLYWYASDFAVEEGDKVFAPVGERNRIQKAVVERVLHTDGAHAPYALSLIKKLEHPCSLRTERVGGLLLTDLGGVRYDDRHFTRFRRLAFCERAAAFSEEESKALAAAGYCVLRLPQTLIENADKILIAGADAIDQAKKILAAARGKETELCYAALARRIL